jgi:hypothetical protein
MTPISLPLLGLAAILGPGLSGQSGGNKSSRRIPAGAWFDPAAGAIVNDPIARLARHSVVLLGETHTATEHHRWQLHTIAGLYALRPDLALGFEMFPRQVQPVLARWTNGELTEAAFLAEVEWERVWGVDPALYLPLFHFARMHRLPMIALNIKRDSQKRFAADPTVPLSEREGVGDPAPATAAYRARLLPWFQQGPMGGLGMGPTRLASHGLCARSSFGIAPWPKQLSLTTMDDWSSASWAAVMLSTATALRSNSPRWASGI